MTNTMSNDVAEFIPAVPQVSDDASHDTEAVERIETVFSEIDALFESLETPKKTPRVQNVEAVFADPDSLGELLNVPD